MKYQNNFAIEFIVVAEKFQYTCIACSNNKFTTAAVEQTENVQQQKWVYRLGIVVVERVSHICIYRVMVLFSTSLLLVLKRSCFFSGLLFNFVIALSYTIHTCHSVLMYFDEMQSSAIICIFWAVRITYIAHLPVSYRWIFRIRFWFAFAYTLCIQCVSFVFQHKPIYCVCVGAWCHVFFFFFIFWVSFTFFAYCSFVSLHQLICVIWIHGIIQSNGLFC